MIKLKKKHQKALKFVNTPKFLLNLVNCTKNLWKRARTRHFVLRCPGRPAGLAEKWLQLILFSKRQTSVSIFCERPLTVKKGQFFDVKYWLVLIELSVKRYLQKRNQNGGWRIWSLWMYIQSWNGNEKITVSIETISILLHRKWMSTGTYLSIIILYEFDLLQTLRIIVWSRIAFLDT